MRNLESRFNSFDGTSLSWNEKMNFAVAGLVKYENGTLFETECAFCDCALSDWSKDDVPYLEHSKRSDNCIMYRLHVLKNRQLTFTDTTIPNEMIITLSEHGFFLFAITDGSLDCFCFKCGFFIDPLNKNMNKRIIEHSKKCASDKYKNNHSLSVFYRRKDLFFLQLLSGQYNSALGRFKSLEMNLSKEQKEEISFLLSLRKSTNPFISVKDVLQETLDIALKKASLEMQEDEEGIRRLLDKK